MVRTALVVLGFLIMAASPLVGVVPGPGGILVFAAGMVLVLRNATWARRKVTRSLSGVTEAPMCQDSLRPRCRTAMV